MRQTTFTKPAEVERTWYVVDGTGKTLGRLATEVAAVLRENINLLIHQMSIAEITLS